MALVWKPEFEQWLLEGIMAMSFIVLKDLRIVPYCTWYISLNALYKLL